MTITEDPSVATPPTAVLPLAVQAAFAAWDKYTAAVSDFNATLVDIEQKEREQRGLRDEDDIYALIISSSCHISTDETAECARRVLVREAEKQFAPTGAKLQIPNPPYDGKESWRACDFSPRAVWEYLSRTYGGSAGADKAYADIAKKLASALGLYRETECKTVGGRVVLSATTYADKRWGEIISYNDSDRLLAVLDGFSAVGEWSGLWNGTEASAVELARGDIDTARSKKVLPEKRMIGEWVIIVPFKSNWTYKLSPAFAEQLNLFISEFYQRDR